MSSFLELVNDVARESGTMGGQSLVSIASATGRWAKLVAWTRQAWEMIQRERPDWTFRRARFEGLLTVGKATYTPIDLGLTDWSGWGQEADGIAPFSLYLPALGRVDESRVTVWNYRDWADRYDFGAHDAARPTTIAFDFTRQLCIGPKPDQAYMLRGEYRRAIQALAADSDIPFIDPEFHQAIVWRALVLLGEDDESQFEAGTSAANYIMARQGMIDAYTEGVEL